jgi:hypothetical protein
MRYVFAECVLDTQFHTLHLFYAFLVIYYYDIAPSLMSDKSLILPEYLL